MAFAEYSSLVLDLGGVLAFYSPMTKYTGLSPRQIKNALDSPCWYDYERGKISKQDCYAQVTATFNIDQGGWELALKQMMDGLQVNKDLIAAISSLKEAHPKLRVYCLSNIPQPESEYLMDQVKSWGIIDELYASSDAGHRKPDAALYKYFLERSGNRAQDCIFVDDTLENIVAARVLGFRAILFQDTRAVVRTLHNLLGDPVARGMAFLKSHAGHLFCQTTSGEVQPDNYSQLLILQNTGDRSLVTLENNGPTWSYFVGPPIFADTLYPNDSDTTSLAMAVFDDTVSAEDKSVAMSTILSHLSPDGLPYCWFDTNRPRFCHCICANVYRFFCLNNRHQDLPSVYNYLYDLLQSKAYLLGTRYYESPDWFLFILADLCARRPHDLGLLDMRKLLVLRLQERVGGDEIVLNACMRLLSAQMLGLTDVQDLERLLNAQQLDGGWELSWLWHYGREPGKVGSRGVVTAMAVNGIRRAREIVAFGESGKNGTNGASGNGIKKVLVE
ncbi:hypothetical protein XA68_17750 [Ophiocordyceps unilateralis]|uniref:HAD-like protein n=1 Tax=Ophiocordyceps unilateralis TaxID=268505 RepID=A0A2A9PSJ5_OPHUN|nr:hypothetical protein XA68_17750 [Ophiocordyceps unilateralis]